MCVRLSLSSPVGFLLSCGIYRYKYSCMILPVVVLCMLICPGISVFSIHLLFLVYVTPYLVVCAACCLITATINWYSRFLKSYISFPLTILLSVMCLCLHYFFVGILVFIFLPLFLYPMYLCGVRVLVSNFSSCVDLTSSFFLYFLLYLFHLVSAFIVPSPNLELFNFNI